MLLVAVPLVTVLGFLWLALAPTFAVLAVVMVVRRFGEYAFVRPGREMLFTVVPTEAKYKAKNFIDTVVYRGADAVSAWAKTRRPARAATGARRAGRRRHRAGVGRDGRGAGTRAASPRPCVRGCRKRKPCARTSADLNSIRAARNGVRFATVAVEGVRRRGRSQPLWGARRP